jgi:hypothetical protein
VNKEKEVSGSPNRKYIITFQFLQQFAKDIILLRCVPKLQVLSAEKSKLSEPRTLHSHCFIYNKIGNVRKKKVILRRVRLTIIIVKKH